MKRVCRWVVPISIGLTGLAMAAEAPKPAPAPAPASTANNPAAAGMRAYVDPETGQLVSAPVSQAQAKALDAQFQSDPDRVEEVRKADGSVEWKLNGQADSALVARRTASGKLEMVCAEHGVVHDHAAVQAQGGRDEQ